MTDDFSQFLPKTAHARPQSADPARSPRAPPSRSRPQSGASPRARMAATASTQVGGASPRPASAAPTYHLLHSPISSSGLRIKSVPMSYGDGVDRRLTAGAKGDPALHRGDKTPAEQLQYELKMTGGLLRDAYKHLNSERVEVALAKAAEEKAKEAARQRRSEADEARREHEASEREFAAQMASQRRELNAEMEALRADGDAKLAEEKAKNAELRAKAEEVRELQRQLEAVERAAEKREAEAAAEYERRLAAEGRQLAAETARQTAAAPAAAPSKKAGSRVLVGLDIDEGSDKSVAEQLRDALSKHAIKVMDLFREWDENGDGNVSKKEFRRAMGLLGFDVPKTEIDALFDAFDPDGSGAMEFKELQKMLRHTAPAADPKAVVSARRASVAAGGRGKGKK